MALPAQHRILPLRGGVAQTEYVQGNVGHLEACVIGSVSYTHLDVYKRQAEALAKGGVKLICQHELSEL